VSDTPNTVETVYKSDLAGHQRGQTVPYTALRDSIARSARDLVRKASERLQGRRIVPGDVVEELRTAKTVAFEVKRGEMPGIIGRNVAGKSTLLEILSRITEPTKGGVIRRGRVASQPEVRTGLHPKLTRRRSSPAPLPLAPALPLGNAFVPLQRFAIASRRFGDRSVRQRWRNRFALPNIPRGRRP
jgi:lipopolysaccharide transport system ATP-binding protein